MFGKNKLSNERKTKLINQSFQWRWIARPILILFIGLIALATVLIFSLNYTIDASYKQYIETLHSTKQLIWPAVVGGTVVVFFIGAILITWQFLRLTHRVAGPMYRLGETFKKLKDGNLTLRISFREGDEFQELADKYNLAVENIDKRLKEIRRELNKISVEDVSDDNYRHVKRVQDILKEFDLSEED